MSDTRDVCKQCSGLRSVPAYRSSNRLEFREGFGFISVKGHYEPGASEPCPACSGLDPTSPT